MLFFCVRRIELSSDELENSIKNPLDTHNGFNEANIKALRKIYHVQEGFLKSVSHGQVKEWRFFFEVLVRWF